MDVGPLAFSQDDIDRRVTGRTTCYSFVPGRTIANAYSYDAASNRASATFDGTTVSYAYDTLNRLSTLTSGFAGQFTFGYDALSRRTSLNRPNSVSTTYTYDSVSRLLSVLHQLGTTTIDGASYGLDPAGNRVSKTNYIDGSNENYTYDALYQLTQVLHNGTTSESYTYDGVGNRLSSLGVPSYTVNSSNELTSDSAATFTYDSNGNTTSKTDASGTTSYAWDFENRLVSVTLPGTGGTVTFKYDPLGRRIQKASPSGTINFAYDGANVVEELNTGGTVTAQYAQGSGIDEPLATNRGGALAFYEADGLGSVTSLTDGTGSALAAYTTDTFGKPVSTADSTVNNPFRYTGREYDAETTLYYYRARYYDPQTGRFLGEDPSDFDGGINFYAYVRNDPANWVDPLGLNPLSFDEIANLVPWFNYSGQSDELIICMAYKESSFDPDASLPGSQSARGLLGVTDAAATQVGVNWDDLGDPATNIAAGSAYLAWRIHLNHGNVRAGLWGYGTGRGYADSLLTCEKCLIAHANERADCKTKECLIPLHATPRPKHNPKPKAHHPKKKKGKQ